MPQYNPNTDCFCLSFHNYLHSNDRAIFRDVLIKKELYEQLIIELNKLSFSQFFETSSLGDTRLHFVIEKLLIYGKLEQNIELIKDILIRSTQLDQQHIQSPLSPTAFLLFNKNINNQSTYELTLTLNIPALSSLLEMVSRSDLNFLFGLSFRIISRNSKLNTSHHAVDAFKSIFRSIDYLGHSFLESIVRPVFLENDFHQTLTQLIKARTKGWLDKKDYQQILLTNNINGFSILHQLILKDPPENILPSCDNLRLYLKAIDIAAKQGTVKEYMAIFEYQNKNGYSVMHQAINAPNLGISRTFLDWFENECSLPRKVKSELLSIKNTRVNSPGSSSSPRRSPKKYGCRETNTRVKQLKEKFSNSRASQYGFFLESQPNKHSDIEYKEYTWCNELSSWHPCGQKYLIESSIENHFVYHL